MQQASKPIIDKPGDHRCSCGKLQFRGLLLMSDLEIKCVRCSKFIHFSSFDDLQKEDAPIVAINENAETVCFNKAAAMMYGYTAEQAATLKAKDFTIVQRPRFTRQILKLMWKIPNRDDYIFHTRLYVRRLDKTTAHIAVTSKLHTINNDLFAVCSAKLIEDVPDQLIPIDMDSPDMSGEVEDAWDCLVDSTGDIIKLNPHKPLHTSGFNAKELTSMRLQDLLSSDDSYQKIAAGMQNPKRVGFTEVDILTASGKTKRMLILLLPTEMPTSKEPCFKLFLADPTVERNKYFE